MTVVLAFALGFAGGLRSMTPLAIVAWASRAWPAVAASSVGFIAAPAIGVLFAAFAAIELVADKLPFMPSRISAAPLVARVLSGALCGVAVAAASSSPIAGGIVGGAAGALAGSYGGYHARRHLTTSRTLPDRAVALAEDVLAMAMSLAAVWMVG